MKEEKEIVFVDSDDWTGMYVNGELKGEGHSLRIDEVLTQLGIKSKSVEADYDWLDEQGSLPAKLSDVKLAE